VKPNQSKHDSFPQIVAVAGRSQNQTWTTDPLSSNNTKRTEYPYLGSLRGAFAMQSGSLTT
jgi:hypothetical protein